MSSKALVPRTAVHPCARDCRLWEAQGSCLQPSVEMLVGTGMSADVTLEGGKPCCTCTLHVTCCAIPCKSFQNGCSCL